jgi:ribosomal protein S18 acetylase RimI-like enzyme
MAPALQIRPITPADHDAVMALAPRLLVGIPTWRDPVAWLATTQQHMEAAFAGTDERTLALVAENERGNIAGFISMIQSRNWTGEPLLYIGELVVAAEAEGMGVGHALLLAAERHARALGLRCIALDTGAQHNDHARTFYRRHGFAEESLRLVRVLDDEDAAE